MKHFYDELQKGNIDRETFDKNDFSINIKLDYSAIIVKYDGSTLLFYGRNLKPITTYTLKNRFSILSSGIDILIANKDRLFTEPGYYHFEYKNPQMKYSLDDGRESGIYFSYYQTMDKKTVRHPKLESEVKINVDIDDLFEMKWYSFEEKYNLELEEGLAIIFYSDQEPLKIISAGFNLISVIKRKNDKGIREARKFIKLYLENTPRSYSGNLGLSLDLFINYLFKGDKDFLAIDPNKLVFSNLAEFSNESIRYYFQKATEKNSIIKTLHGVLGESSDILFELYCFIYITIRNIEEKKISPPSAKQVVKKHAS